MGALVAKLWVVVIVILW